MRFHKLQLQHPNRHRLSALTGALILAMSFHQQAQALDLMESYQLAMQQDANYQAALANTEASREAIPQARAQLLPNLSGTVSQSRNNTNSTTQGLAGQPVSNSYHYQSSSYALTVRQPLYRKFNFAQYEQAQSQVASAEAMLNKDLQDLAVRLSGAYLEALMAQHQLELVRSAKEAYGAQLEAAKHSFKAGMGSRTDIDDAQARYDMNVAQELEASQNISYTRRQLQTIINQPTENLARLDPARMELTSPVPADPEAWVVRGEEANSELRAMRANIEAAQQEIEKAKAGHTPTIDLVAQRSRNDSANDQTINNLYLTTQLGIQANIPIFANGYVNSQVRQAQANLKKHQQLYEAKRREISLQIRKEHQNVTEGILKIKALEQAERSAVQAVISNQKGFQAGIRTRIDILNAEQQRMNTLHNLAQERYLYMMARIRLQGLAGSLNETEIRTINNWLTYSDIRVSSIAVE